MTVIADSPPYFPSPSPPSLTSPHSQQDYNPYDLVVVDPARADPASHFIITQSGVTHMR